MRPDPGRDLQEALLIARTPDERALLSARLRAAGMALVWDQLDRAGITDPLETAMFLLDRLYPELPGVHREQLRRRIGAEVAAGTWDGFRRPVSPVSEPG